jgi:hypothetical protein
VDEPLALRMLCVVVWYMPCLHAVLRSTHEVSAYRILHFGLLPLRPSKYASFPLRLIPSSAHSSLGLSRQRALRLVA